MVTFFKDFQQLSGTCGHPGLSGNMTQQF